MEKISSSKNDRAGETTHLISTNRDITERRRLEARLQQAGKMDAVINLMITDVIMPHMGGTKLAEQMASDRPLMKVLFVSGYAESTALRQRAIDVTRRFLQKPFSLNTLAGKIREILDNDLPAIAASASPG